MAPPYKQLWFKCENYSCLHVEACGEAHLWAPYLRREELEKEHKLCREGNLRLPDGRWGKVVAGPFGLHVYLSLDPSCRTEPTTLKVIDPRLLKILHILERSTGTDAKFHDDMPFWNHMKYDIAVRYGRSLAFRDINFQLKYRKKVNIVEYVKRELARDRAEWERYQQLYKQNVETWRRQARDERDASLLQSNPNLGRVNGKIWGYTRALRLLQHSDRIAVFDEALEYVEELKQRLVYNMRAYDVTDWKPIWAEKYKGSWKRPRNSNVEICKPSKWSYPL